ncbi:hypothetical protein [Ureibacillus thermosphaericus]|uniref:hypothetical protein n=1 Tax=Ureibacillus thermosphaericus TaxID=51173 RepID=UPI0030C9A582
MYEKEADLVSHFINRLIEKNNNQLIITELETNFGRPDIVVIEIDNELLEKRKNNLSSSEYSREMSYITTYLYKKSWLKKDKLKEYFHFSEKKLTHIIKLMNNEGLIEIRDDKIKLKPSNEVLVIKRLRVIEAKLTNWKYVINQAQRHLWFSNESYILMPNNSESILEQAKKCCIDYGIGMITLLNGKIKYFNRIKKQKLINTPLLWELNEKIVRGDLKNEHFHI